MHALHLPTRQLWRAAVAALVLAFAFALASVDLSGVQIHLGGGSTAEPAAPVTAPAGKPDWVKNPMTPPTAELSR